MLEELNKSKNTERNKIQIDLIKSRLVNLKNEIKRCLKMKKKLKNQILSRLLISLAQLKSENNSGKLKNEIRQFLYSLYRSKKLTKTIYKNLISTN